MIMSLNRREELHSGRRRGVDRISMPLHQEMGELSKAIRGMVLQSNATFAMRAAHQIKLVEAESSIAVSNACSPLSGRGIQVISMPAPTDRSSSR